MKILNLFFVSYCFQLNARGKDAQYKLIVFVQFACGKKFSITQHFGVSFHKNKLKNLTNVKSESLLAEFFFNTQKMTNQQEYCFEMCEAFLNADIPLSKLNNPKLWSFLKKRTMKSVADESTLRKNYVHKVFQKTKQAIFMLMKQPIHVDVMSQIC